MTDGPNDGWAELLKKLITYVARDVLRMQMKNY